MTIKILIFNAFSETTKQTAIRLCHLCQQSEIQSNMTQRVNSL
jgi:IS1 family transposase